MLNHNLGARIVFLIISPLVIGCVGCSQKSDVSYTPSNATDQNWDKGIAKTWAAAFIVDGSVQAKRDFMVDKKVILADGSVRRIIEVKHTNGSLIVFVNGSPLDGNKVGYANKLKVTDDAIEYDVPYSITNYTDENWVKGIATTWAAAFFVRDSPEAKRDFAVGKKVTFADGSVRTIVQQKENAGDLILFLDGAPLDGNMVGYPKELKITDATKQSK
jgi:endoglucanase